MKVQFLNQYNIKELLENRAWYISFIESNLDGRVYCS